MSAPFEFSELIKELYKAYGKSLPEDIKDTRVSAFHIACGTYPFELVKQGMKHAISTRRFVPAPSELRADCETMQKDQAKTMAWTPGMDDGETCLYCEDTGFAYLNDIGRQLTMHEAVMEGARRVRPCDCRRTNRRYQRKRAAQWAAALIKADRRKYDHGWNDAE